MYSLGDTLNELGSNGSIKIKLAEAKVLNCWGEVVGEAVQKNSCPQKVVNGILFVKTKSPSWAQELKVLDNEIKRKINEMVGSVVVREIRFVCDNNFIKAEGEQEREGNALDLAAVKISQVEEQIINEIVSGVNEDALREELQKLVALNKKLNKVRAGNKNKK